MKIESEVGLPWRKYKPTEIWDAITDSFESIDIPRKFYCKANNLNHLKKKEHFRFETDECSVDFCSVGHHQLDRLGFETDRLGSTEVIGFIDAISKRLEVRQGFISNYDYRYWQNAHDKLQYDAVGRSYAHLPLKSNGLPFPLEQEVIDTSRNPGKRSLEYGYIDFISSTMWLTTEWPLLAEALEQEKIEMTKVGSTYRFSIYPELFTTDERKEGELQGHFRALLFSDESLTINVLAELRDEART